MSNIIKELEQYPDPMSKAQFCRACHISNTTGAYLVESGLVPSKRVGKAQWFITISKADAICYIERRQVDRRYYQEASVTGSHQKREQPAFSALLELDFSEDSAKKLKKWIGKRLHSLPDVIRVCDVSMLTGYHEHTVSRWCTEKRLPCTVYHNKALIPKMGLIDFLTSEKFNAINRKSELHYKIMTAFKCSSDLPEWDEAVRTICATPKRGV